MHPIARAKQAEILDLCWKHGLIQLELFDFAAPRPEGCPDAYFGLLEHLH